MAHTKDFLGSRPFAILVLCILVPLSGIIIYAAASTRVVLAQEDQMRVANYLLENGVVHLEITSNSNFECNQLNQSHEDCQKRFWQAIHQAQTAWEKDNPDFFEMSFTAYGLQNDGLLPRGVVILYQPQVDVPALMVVPMTQPDEPEQPRTSHKNIS